LKNNQKTIEPNRLESATKLIISDRGDESNRVGQRISTIQVTNGNTSDQVPKSNIFITH
jgi:hypothetical protein